MPRRRYSSRYPSWSEDSYRIAPPLPHARRRRGHRSEPQAVPTPQGHYPYADEVRVAPKPKPWNSKSRKSHYQGRQQDDEVESPRVHSVRKSKRRTDRQQYTLPPNIRENPFFKDIFEDPKPLKVKEPRKIAPAPPKQVTLQPKKVMNPPPPPPRKDPIKTPKKQNTKPKVTHPAPPTAQVYNEGIPPPGYQNTGIQHSGGQMPYPDTQQPPPPPPGHQRPPPPPPGHQQSGAHPSQHGQVTGHGASTQPYVPGYNTNAPVYAPNGQTPNAGRPSNNTGNAKLNDVLNMYRNHYSQPQFQNSKWGMPAAPAPTGNQHYLVPTNGNQNGVNQYQVSSNTEAEAKHEKAQRDLAAATAAHEKAIKDLAALEAKGPDRPKAQTPSKHDNKESHVARLEREYREAAEQAREAQEAYDRAREARKAADEAARIARLQVPKKVSFSSPRPSPDRSRWATVEDYQSDYEPEAAQPEKSTGKPQSKLFTAAELDAMLAEEEAKKDARKREDRPKENWYDTYGGGRSRNQPYMLREARRHQDPRLGGSTVPLHDPRQYAPRQERHCDSRGNHIQDENDYSDYSDHRDYRRRMRHRSGRGYEDPHTYS